MAQQSEVKPEKPEVGGHLLEESILPTWLNQRAVTF
jgi:hypothetical protein